MPLTFAYGANMDVAAVAERCPRSRPLGAARLMRHRLVVMSEGWLSMARDPNAIVHGVLWDVARADYLAAVIAAARRWSLPTAALERLAAPRSR